MVPVQSSVCGSTRERGGSRGGGVEGRACSAGQQGDLDRRRSRRRQPSLRLLVAFVGGEAWEWMLAAVVAEVGGGALSAALGVGQR